MKAPHPSSSSGFGTRYLSHPGFFDPCRKWVEAPQKLKCWHAVLEGFDQAAYVDTFIGEAKRRAETDV